MEQRVVMLGERIADDSRRLASRYRSTPAWLGLLTPVVERASALASAPERFERREVAPLIVPSKASLVANQDAASLADHEPTLVWPNEIDARPLAANLRDALRPMIGPHIDQALLHTGHAADSQARSRGADAVTIGTDVHFRRGAFAPDTPAGRGLIAHELTHVAAGLAPGVDWRRSSDAGLKAEEALAHARENAVARAGAPSPLTASAVAPWAPVKPRQDAPAPAPAAASPQARPMLAETGRPAVGASPAPLAMPNLDQLRDGLYRDIMARIRVDFERGA